MRKGVIGVGVLVLAAGAAGALYSRSRSEKDKPYKLVEVTRGPVVEKALAVGAIRPKREIAVKSKISGIVKRSFREVGDRVNTGDPLFEILPDPTPMELTEARREVEIARNIYDQAKKRSDRTAALSKQGIVSSQESDTADKEIQDAQIRLNLSQERLALVEKGRVKTTHLDVESIIRAPVSGTVLELLVNEGDPVVPLTSYQAGTPLTTLADMSQLVFKGTVDEIDVGKLKESMPARIKIGAMPDAAVEGTVYKIAPKSKTAEGATLFDVEIALKPGSGGDPARGLLRERGHRRARETERAPDPGAARHLRRRQGDDRGASTRRGRAREEGDQGRPLRRHQHRGRGGPAGQGPGRRAAPQED
jgi:HlyD family secretion protein